MIHNLLRSIAVAFAVVLLSGAARAQEPEPLTEIDRLRIENVRLQELLAAAYADGDSCRTQLAPYRKAENDAAVRKAKEALKAQIEAAHDGHVYHIEAGTLERRPAGAEKP